MDAGLVDSSMVKGLLSTGIGLLITVIGTDPIGGAQRFTYGSEFISAGFPFLPVLIGIFAFSQIMSDIEKQSASGAAKTAEGALAEGAVVTIEPGIYRPGWGGVRIEDDVFLGPGGPRILTRFTRELIELG